MRKAGKEYTDDLDAFADAILAIETIDPSEWVQGVAFGRWHPDSGNKGPYWNINVTRIIGSGLKGQPTADEAERTRQRGREMTRASFVEWQRKEAAKAVQRDATEGGRYDNLGSSGSDQG